MKYEMYFISHGGNFRNNNEDNAYLNGFYRNDNQEFAFGAYSSAEDNFDVAVFDGMGGEENGEMASLIGVEMFDYFLRSKDEFDIKQYVHDSGAKIIEKSGGVVMGTTVVSLNVRNDVAQFFNVGDSRGYLISQNQIVQMTKDHSIVAELVRRDMLSKEDVKTHPDRHAIYRFLGYMDKENHLAEADTSDAIILNADEYCVLCSDGLTDTVDNDEICEIVSDPSISIKQKAGKLVYRALETGSKDNVTVLIVRAL